MDSELKMVTCILHEGVAHAVMQKLKDQFGIITSNFHYARGIGKSAPLLLRGMGEQAEKEILSVVVDQQRADEVFEFIFIAAGLDHPHAGIVFMHPLRQASEYSLPKIPTD
ncbi:MAG: P-II family nitrogen regulator [Mariprofundales bacterium]